MHKVVSVIFITAPYHTYFTLVSKGNAAHLMKVGSKRRRGKAEIKEQKRAEAQRQNEIAA